MSFDLSQRSRVRDSQRLRYFHVVFTVPAEVADIALHNKAAVYDLLFHAASETMLTIAADPTTSAPTSASPPCSIRGDRR
jgi:hypothetical protein